MSEDAYLSWDENRQRMVIVLPPGNPEDEGELMADIHEVLDELDRLEDL